MTIPGALFASGVVFLVLALTMELARDVTGNKWYGVAGLVSLGVAMILVLTSIWGLALT